MLVFDVPLPRPGQYAFEISLDGELASRVASRRGIPNCKVRSEGKEGMTWTRDRALADARVHRL